VIPVVDISLTHEDTDYVPVIDTYTWKPQQCEKMCMDLAEVVQVDRWYWELVRIYTIAVT